MPAEPEHPDDNLMERFDRAGLRRFRARDGVIAVAIAAVILILTAGPSIRKQGEAMNQGIGATSCSRSASRRRGSRTASPSSAQPTR
jgi:hypothetical protein